MYGFVSMGLSYVEVDLGVIFFGIVVDLFIFHF